MIVAVGSTNPTKTKPVDDVFSRFYENLKVVGIKAPSGVKEQPMSEVEAYEGALNRAQFAIKHIKDAEFGVGIEGGIRKEPFGYFEQSLVVIVDKSGRVGIGASGGLVLPQKIIAYIEKGKTLEDAIDAEFGTKKIGEGIGMFGVFTKGVVTRSSGVAHGVAFALARFLHRDVYDMNTKNKDTREEMI